MTEPYSITQPQRQLLVERLGWKKNLHRCSVRDGWWSKGSQADPARQEVLFSFYSLRDTTVRWWKGQLIPGGYPTKFYTWGFASRSKPSPFCIPFSQKKVSQSYTFNSKRVPLSHSKLALIINKSPKRKSSCRFQVVHNNWNDTAIKVCPFDILNERPELRPFKMTIVLKWLISHSSHIPQHAKSLPFYIPKDWKRYPFRPL